MAGFVSGESFGCFSISMGKYGKGKLDSVSLSFRVSQHLRDELLLRSFIPFFGCGIFNYHNGSSKYLGVDFLGLPSSSSSSSSGAKQGVGVFIVRKFADISDKILPFFKYHKIQGIKGKDFED